MRAVALDEPVTVPQWRLRAVLHRIVHKPFRCGRGGDDSAQPGRSRCRHPVDPGDEVAVVTQVETPVAWIGMLVLGGGFAAGQELPRRGGGGQHPYSLHIQIAALVHVAGDDGDHLRMAA